MAIEGANEEEQIAQLEQDFRKEEMELGEAVLSRAQLCCLWTVRRTLKPIIQNVSFKQKSRFTNIFKAI